jgi:Holliday junction resolvase RusA-like endonuclease
MAKRIDAADVDVPTYAHEIEGGYPCAVFVDDEGKLTVHIFGHVLSSPRPRVTSRGTFMPSDYRKHCDKLACSLAAARGVYEGKCGPWPVDKVMKLDLSFWSPKMPGDLDNLAKTIMDAGQLHRGEESGAELWTNDKQIQSLAVSWKPSEEPNFYVTMAYITVMS